MKGPGLLTLIEYGIGFAMAGPLVMVGLDLLAAGDTTFGVAAVAIGLVSIFFPSWLVRQIGGPRTWIGRRTGGLSLPKPSNPLRRFRR